jgi:hypothetical protein
MTQLAGGPDRKPEILTPDRIGVIVLLFLGFGFSWFWFFLVSSFPGFAFSGCPTLGFLRVGLDLVLLFLGFVFSGVCFFQGLLFRGAPPSGF